MSKAIRSLESGDIVRVGSKTGVVHKIEDDSVSVFITQNNPYGIAVWYSKTEVKRIGRVNSNK